MKISDALAGVSSIGIEASPFIYIEFVYDALLTNDFGIKRVQEIEVYLLDELENDGCPSM